MTKSEVSSPAGPKWEDLDLSCLSKEEAVTFRLRASTLSFQLFLTSLFFLVGFFKGVFQLFFLYLFCECRWKREINCNFLIILSTCRTQCSFESTFDRIFFFTPAKIIPQNSIAVKGQVYIKLAKGSKTVRKTAFNNHCKLQSIDHDNCELEL